MVDQIILGILQGVFEWLPISSEAVVALTSSFLNTNVNPIDLAIFLHLGTLLASIIYFRHDWWNIIRLKDKKTFKFLLISTPITMIIGYFIYGFAKEIVIGGYLLLLTGLALIFTAYFNSKKKKFNLSYNKLAIVSGVLQGIAAIPGFSRSGSTIFGLSLGQLEPKEILKISYLMSAPVILLSNIYLLIKEPVIFNNGWISLIFSFVFGILTLHLLLTWSKKINFTKFALVFAFFCFVGFFLI